MAKQTPDSRLQGDLQITQEEWWPLKSQPSSAFILGHKNGIYWLLFIIVFFLLLFYIQWQAFNDLKCIKVQTLPWPASSDPSLPYLLLASQIEELTDKDQTQVSDPWRWEMLEGQLDSGRKLYKWLLKFTSELQGSAWQLSEDGEKYFVLTVSLSCLLVREDDLCFALILSIRLGGDWQLVLLCGEKTVCSKLGKKYERRLQCGVCLPHRPLSWPRLKLYPVIWWHTNLWLLSRHLPTWSRAPPA